MYWEKNKVHCSVFTLLWLNITACEKSLTESSLYIGKGMKMKQQILAEIMDGQIEVESSLEKEQNSRFLSHIVLLTSLYFYRNQQKMSGRVNLTENEFFWLRIMT